MKTRFFLIAGLVAIGLVACTEDIYQNDVVNNVSPDGLRIEVMDEFAKEATRADYTGFPVTEFEEGDAIGVYAFNGTSYVSSNVKFTKQSDGSWTPAASVVYNPDYTYFAYFPWVSSTPSIVTSGDVDARFANFITSNTFWKTDQSSKANFTASNLMAAQGIVTGERTVKFTMAHKRGLAIISDAVNLWYYTDAAGTKYNLTPVFSGNIPYEESGTRYFLMKPNTATSVAGLSLRAGAGKYMRSEGIEITGTPTYQYSLSTNNGSSFGSFNSTKPSWLTITPNVVDGEPTEISVAVTNSTSTSVSLGSGNSRDVSADAALKAAASVSNVDLSMVDNAGNARASRMTANCYLVHAAGTYKIPLVYGNAIKNGSTNSSAYYTDQTSNTLQRLVNHANAGITDPWIKTVVGSSPNGASLVWEDVKGMISAVGIDGDFLTFTVSSENIAEGNAVIAATLSGTTVWSWHIWVTGETLASLTTINTGSHTYQVAPVNVGQVNGKITAGATIYAGEQCKVRATANGVTMEFLVRAKNYTTGGTAYYYPSPYYQWGRKDAMYPSTGGFNSAGTLISTYSGTTLVTATSATPGATIQHPDYWYNNTSNYNPYDTNSTYAGKYNYWDMNQTSTGNITTATVKTVYDPCPPGFCVPTGNLYYYANSNSGQTAWQNTPPGRNWTISGTPIFFPASGARGSNNGSLSLVASYGEYWSATAGGSGSAHILTFNSSSWSWSFPGRTTGFSVRAVAEE